MSRARHPAPPPGTMPSVARRRRAARRLPWAPVAPVLAVALALASCMEIGPTVRVEAPAGKSQAAWDQDRAECTSGTDRAIQPFANGLNAEIGRSVDQMRADNDRIQHAYDDRYGRCMAARGNWVAGLPPVPTPAPAPDDAVAQVQEGFALSPPMDAVSASAADSVGPQVREFRTACPGELIAVDVRPAPISRTVTARLVALTEPHGGACFGNKGEVDYLVLWRADGWETLLSGLLALAGTRHRGFVDVELQGAGTCVRTHSWDGHRYVVSGARGC